MSEERIAKLAKIADLQLECRKLLDQAKRANIATLKPLLLQLAEKETEKDNLVIELLRGLYGK